MKKITVFILLVCILTSLFSCGSNNEPVSGTSETSVGAETSEQSEASYAGDVDKSSAYICDTDELNCVQLVFSSPASIPEGDGAVIYSPTTQSVGFDGKGYALQLKRGVKSTFTVEKTGIDKTDSRAFTVLFRNDADIAEAKKFFTVGKEVKIINSDRIHKYGNKMTAVIGGVPYTVTDKNTDTIDGDGVYLFDNRRDYTVTPQTDKDRVDVIVMENIVAYVGQMNEKTFFPSVNGYVLSFVGSCAADVSVSFGDSVEMLLFEPFTSPETYVEVNGYRQEVNYFNTTRTSYAGAVVYDSDFKDISTDTNEWGLEIAFDSDGKAVSVKEGGAKDSGNTPIPENGFVLSVCMDSPLYSKLCKTYEGADGRLVKNVTPYSVHKMKLDGRNIPRVGETAVVYDASYGSKTPVVGNGQLELICGADGYVVGLGDPNGGNDIPENGFIIAFYGMRYDEVRDFYHVGSRFFVNGSNTFLYIFTYPSVKISEGKALIEKYKAEYKECAEKLKNIDYDKAEDALLRLDSLMEDLEKGVTENALSSLAEIESTLSSLEYSFVESLRVQDRCGWAVSMPKNADEVEKVCENAKKLGLNTLIVSAFNDVYATYPSEIDGVVMGSQYNGFDVLGAFIEKGHSHGLKVYVMFACFAAGRTLEGLPEEHYVNRFAKEDKLLESRSGTNENRYYDDVTYTLDPFDNDVRDFFTSVITEVAEKYDVDGIQLDYIRFPLPNRYGDLPDDFGYNANTVKAFAEKTGITVDPHSIGMKSEYWDEWCAFRRDIITSFAVSLGEKIKAIKKDVNYSVTCFADYNDRQNYVYQSPEYLASNGYVDGVYTMIYADNYESEFSYASDIFGRMGDGAHLVAGVGTYVRATNDDLNRQLGISGDIGCDGVSVFGVSYAFSCGYLDVFRKGAFRKKAIRTDCGSVIVAAFSDDMLERIDNVYSRFCPDDGLAPFTEKLKEIHSKASDASYGGNIAEDLQKLRESLTFADEKLKNDVERRIDFIISCLNR